MNNRRALLVALSVGFISLLLTQWYLSQEQKRLAGRYELITVVVAAKDVRRYEKITEDMIAFRKIPKPYVQPLAIKANEKDKIVNFNIADSTIKKGEQITQTKLGLIGEGRISPIIPTGKRACTISVNEITGVAGLIRSLDTVDIIGTFRTIEKTTKIPKSIEAITLLQDITVLAVGQNYKYDRPEEATGKNGKLFESSSAAVNFSNVTLLLSPRECMDLAVAQELGQITLSLRSYQDRFSQELNDDLKKNPSTSKTVTGISAPLSISNTPKWLEIRGGQSSYVP